MKRERRRRVSRPNTNYRARRNAQLRDANAPAVQAATPAEPPVDEAPPSEFPFPQAWSKGQLLNVRNAGSHYNVTVMGEEYDTRSPERCLQFSNSFDCQQFVSWWYAPQGTGR